jgi:hypothetical protein
MTPRKKTKADRHYPDDWTVHFEWTFAKAKKERVITSRRFDIKAGQPGYQFERHVVTGAGVEWVDVFELYSVGGFPSAPARLDKPGPSARRTKEEKVNGK